MVKIDNSR